MVITTLKRQLLLAFVGALGVATIPGCSDDTTYLPSAGAGGKAAAGAAPADAGEAGTPSDAGAPSEGGSSGHGGAPGDAGSSGEAGDAGSDAGGSGGTAAGSGGTAGASAGSGGTAGASAGSGGTAGASAGSGGTAGASAGSGGTAGAATSFTLQATTLGQVIGAANGHTLYVFKPDTPGIGNTVPVSTCSGGCLTTWPLYYGNPVTVPEGLLASDFGSFDRGGGVLQSTYKGWPLYFYAPDTAIGDVKGNGANNGNWLATKLPFVSPK